MDSYFQAPVCSEAASSALPKFKLIKTPEKGQKLTKALVSWLGVQMVWSWRMPTAASPLSQASRLGHTSSLWQWKMRGTCRAKALSMSSSKKVRAELLSHWLSLSSSAKPVFRDTIKVRNGGGDNVESTEVALRFARFWKNSVFSLILQYFPSLPWG